MKGDPRQADVVIYDVVAIQDDNGRELDTILEAGVILALGRPLRPDLAARAITHGAAGTLPAEASVEDIITALRDIAAGRDMSVGIHDATQAKMEAVEGLTPRVVTVLRGVARGLSKCPDRCRTVHRHQHREVGPPNRLPQDRRHNPIPSDGVVRLQHGFEPEPREPTSDHTVS